jgi:putative membrane protein
MERSKRAAQIGTGILVIFHIIGLIGFSLEITRPLFQQLVPFNLLLSIGLLGYFHQEWNQKFVIFCLIIFLAGFGVEMLGVNTGKIFGAYVYDSALGPKIWHTPPMIGINWLMLIYVTGVSLQNIKWPKWALAALGATILVSLDFIMEPVAIAFDFWHWLGEGIPLQNFIAWWAIAWGMLMYFLYLPIKKQNPLAGILLLIQFVFFGLLRAIVM